MMVKKAGILALFLILSSNLVFSQSSIKAVVGGTVVNPDTTALLENSVILIEGDSITAVGIRDSVQVPDSAEIIDADGKWIIPGLIDAHVHFFQSGGLYTRPDVIDLRKQKPYKEELKQIKNSLDDTFKRYLRSGITSVVDVGGPLWNFQIRERAYNNPEAPRVAVAGPLISTYQPSELTTEDPPIIKVNSPKEARELVRKQVEEEPDLIKIWYIVRPEESPEDHLPIINATIDESHKNNIPVAVHATQLATAKAAVNAGADILVHSITDQQVDKEFITLLKENDIIYTTTLVVFEGYTEVLTQQVDLLDKEHQIANPDIVSTLFDLMEIPGEDLPESIVKGMEDPPPARTDTTALVNLKILQDSSITISAGTDAGNIGTLHGPALFREFQLMAKAGLTPKEILKAATINNARLMGQADNLGTIEEGKLADLLILNSNPLDDIMNTGDLHLLVKGGIVHDPESLLTTSPADIVQQQINAYNDRNLDAFLNTHSTDIKVYQYPDSLIFSGLPAMRSGYQSLFKNAPDLHAKITDHITYGNYVIEKGRVTGLPNDTTREGVAIYRVIDEKIDRVWFIRD